MVTAKPCSRREVRQAAPTDEEPEVQQHAYSKWRENCAWTPHDLWRTGATLMQSLGVSLEIIDRCQNHVLPGCKVRRHYLHHLMRHQVAQHLLHGCCIDRTVQAQGRSAHSDFDAPRLWHRQVHLSRRCVHRAFCQCVSRTRNTYGQKFRLGKSCDADAAGKMRTPPLVQHVCIDAIVQREAGYRNVCLAGGDRQPFLEINAVIVPSLAAGHPLFGSSSSNIAWPVEQVVARDTVSSLARHIYPGIVTERLDEHRGERKASSASSCSVFSAIPVQSCSRTAWPLELNTNGTPRVRRSSTPVACLRQN